MPKPRRVTLDPIGPLVIAPDIPNMLATAPIDSPEFRIATDAFLDILLQVTRNVETAMAPYLMALRTRFADGKDLDKLARRINICRVSALFCEEIGIAPDGSAAPPLLEVSRFVLAHHRECDFCREHSLVIRALRKRLARMEEAEAADEADRRLDDALRGRVPS